MEQHSDRLLTDILGHLIKHLVTAELVLHQRISLAIGLQAHTLTELIHIVNVIHPLPVNHL